jgi:hypothetical protein
LPTLKQIVDKYKNLIQFESDEANPALCDDLGVSFNGIGEKGHETFHFKAGKKSDDFCKTARKPYDLPVSEILLVLKAHLPSFELSSDGFASEASNPQIDGAWPQAIENVKTYGIFYKLLVSSQGPGREKFCNITPIFDRFESCVMAGMENTMSEKKERKPRSKMKTPSKKALLAAIRSLLSELDAEERDTKLIESVKELVSYAKP